MIAEDRRPGQSPAIEASSPAMLAALRAVARVADHDLPVLFRGESGSGKGALARLLHAASRRRTHRLVVIDCLAVQADAAQAASTLPAKVEEALGGSILFEEVGALPPHIQAAVVSLLETHSMDDRAADARVIATSRLDLEAVARTGLFRKDLLTCLGAVEIDVPPLRDRREDILPLSRCFLESFAPLARADVTPRAQRALLAYAWPGNVRELRNIIQRATVLSEGPVLDLDVFPPQLSSLA